MTCQNGGLITKPLLSMATRGRETEIIVLIKFFEVMSFFPHQIKL